jgi:serine/threonine protein kinase
MIFPERLKIIDFGLARDLSRVKTDSVPISICGTVEFISPEVMACTNATIASDMWSVGVVLYMMVS